MPSRTGALAGSLALHGTLALVLSAIRFAGPNAPQFSQPVTLFPPPPMARPSAARARLRPLSRQFVAPVTALISPPTQAMPPGVPIITPAAPAVPAIAAVELPPPIPPPTTATLALPARGEHQTPAPTATFVDAAARQAGNYTRLRVQVGSFDQAVSGPSVAGVGSAHTSAAAAGFDASPPERTPERSRQWKSSEFSDLAMTAPAAIRKTVAARVETVVEILSKPRPVYSDAARRLGLEGDVLLEAAFQASGQVRVLRVIRGLGHGLDENAVQAAGGIRFRPATVNGSAVDTVAIVRITFQIAN